MELVSLRLPQCVGRRTETLPVTDQVERNPGGSLGGLKRFSNGHVVGEIKML